MSKSLISNKHIHYSIFAVGLLLYSNSAIAGGADLFGDMLNVASGGQSDPFKNIPELSIFQKVISGIITLFKWAGGMGGVFLSAYLGVKAMWIEKRTPDFIPIITSLVAGYLLFNLDKVAGYMGVAMG